MLIILPSEEATLILLCIDHNSLSVRLIWGKKTTGLYVQNRSKMIKTHKSHHLRNLKIKSNLKKNLIKLVQ